MVVVLGLSLNGIHDKQLAEFTIETFGIAQHNLIYGD